METNNTEETSSNEGQTVGPNAQELSEQLAEIKKQNLEKFIAEVSQACLKYDCKIITQAIFTEGVGMEFKLIPQNN